MNWRHYCATCLGIHEYSMELLEYIKQDHSLSLATEYRLFAGTPPYSPAKSEPRSRQKLDSDKTNEIHVDLGNNRRASISDFKGRKLLDLREFYEKDGEVLLLIPFANLLNAIHSSAHLSCMVALHMLNTLSFWPFTEACVHWQTYLVKDKTTAPEHRYEIWKYTSRAIVLEP